VREQLGHDGGGLPRTVVSDHRIGCCLRRYPAGDERPQLLVLLPHYGRECKRDLPSAVI
jgi:hypothetical protein